MVSICIPTFNRGDMAVRAIISALAQTFADIEVLVSDDHSTDETTKTLLDVARADRRVRFIRQPTNLGLVRNFTACIAAARGEFIKFLCDDDLLERDCLAKLLEAFRAHPDITLAACARKLVNDNLQPIGIRAARCRSGVVDGKEMLRELLIRGNSIGEPSAVLFRRLDAARGFDARYQHAFDLEMWCYLLHRGALAFVAEPLCSVRIHGGQATQGNISSGSIIEDKQLMFRELLPSLTNHIPLADRWLWDLRMASSVGRMRARRIDANADQIAEVFHAKTFRRALVPLATFAWSLAR